MSISAERLRPVLQYRWKISGPGDSQKALYYGLRNFPDHARRMVPLSREAADLIQRLDGSKTVGQILEASPDTAAELEALIKEGVLVDQAARKTTPGPENCRTCIQCVNNDHLLPGLEFDENGVCAFCQCYEKVEDSGPVHGGTITDQELVAAAKANPGRYDAMVLYTGGKDSSYLLWYLAEKLKLRVLAATWDLPFTNDSSRQNMRAARTCLPQVEFVERSLPWELIQKVSRELFDETGLPCICPIIALVLFYPLAAAEKIPFIMDGVEAAQLAILKKIMGPAKDTGKKPLSDRELTFGQISRFASPNPDSGDPWDAFLLQVKNKLGRVYEPLEHVLKTVPMEALPLMKRLKSETVYGTWDQVRQVIETHLDWQMPPGQKGLLHTSCDIETVKDYSQFRRFQDMRTLSMPQSVIEISAAVHFGQITREQGLTELSERGYSSPPAELTKLLDKLSMDRSCIGTMPGEMPCICKEILE